MLEGNSETKQAVVRTGRGLLFVLAVALVGVVPASAQETGRIVGRVVTGPEAEPLAGAQVTVDGTAIGALTNADGRSMLLRVPAGTHTLVAQSVGYATERVAGVEVRPDRPATVTIPVSPEAIEVDEIRVTALAEKGSTTALMDRRKNSAGVADAIGAEQIASSPDGDAAAALSRVPGVSVVEGKYVYVRGLGERYGATTLNGATLPSPEPDKKAVPLDLIPSGFLESVTTSKTYSPDRPGDYAGGLVEIQTRDFPAFRITKLSSSAGYNTVTSLQPGLGYDGGSLDFLGFDDGARALPDLVPLSERVSTGGLLTRSDLEAIGESFLDGAWAPTRENLPLDHGFSAAVGDQIRIGDAPLGYLATLTHSNGFSHKDGLVERVFSSPGPEEPEVDYAGMSTTHAVNLGGLFNLGYRPSETDRITLETIYSRSVDDEARILEGYNHDSDADLRSTRLRYLAQTLFSAQLQGRHEVARLGGAGIEWRTGYSRAGRYEPNTREVLYRRAPDGRLLWESFIQSGSVFHSNLHEDGWTGAVDLDVPLEWAGRRGTLGFGLSSALLDRDSYARRFRFLPVGAVPDSVRALGPNEIFSTETVGPDGFQVQEATFREDNYVAAQQVHAAYLMLDADVLPRVRVEAGARLERAIQSVTPRDLFWRGLEPIEGADLDDTDVLPALNLTYRATDAMNVRLGVSQTLARPQLRELAPFSFANYAGGHLTVGNPLLDRSRIRNYDLRWEWFPGAGGVIAASVFYKRFQNPIEVVVFPSTELIKSWVNADAAENYGAEIEMRGSLGFVAAPLDDLTVNLNLTLVRSRIEMGESVEIYIPRTGALAIGGLDETRPLQGQSPYVVNLGLSYFNPSLGTTATLLYNRFGARIDAVGGVQLADIYEAPRQQLDLTLEQPLPGGFDLGLSAERLLGDEVVFTQAGGVVRRYHAGRSISISVSWNGGE